MNYHILTYPTSEILVSQDPSDHNTINKLAIRREGKWKGISIRPITNRSYLKEAEITKEEATMIMFSIEGQ